LPENKNIKRKLEITRTEVIWQKATSRDPNICESEVEGQRW